MADPVLIKRNLTVASLFVTSFEMLKASIQDRLKGSLCRDAIFNEQGEIEFEESEDYKIQVSKRHIPNINRKKLKDYHLFYSSCLWLQEANVISKDEFDEIQKIRQHRNLIVHNPLKLILDDSFSVNVGLLKRSQQLLTKIERWWIIEFEIPINPSFDGMEINENEIQSGASILLNYLMEIADG